MTKPFDAQAFAAAAVARLTGPGGRFEMAVEEVLGAPMPVLRNRARSLGEVLATAADWGARDYLVTEDRRISFTEHAAAVGALAAALRDRYGLGRGDRIGILAANTPEWVCAFWAAQQLGAIAVGYNAWWTPREIAYGVEHTSPAVLIVDAKRAALVAELDIRVPVLTMEHDLPALLAEYSGATPALAPMDEDDPAVVLYTSGTSGRPKGAVHSHRNLVAVIGYHQFNDALAAEFAGAGAVPSGRRFLLTSPLFHIASLHNLVVPRLVTGDTAVLYQGGFDADRVLRLIERERVTNWGAMPTMATRLLERDLSGYDLSSLVSFSLNSAPSSAALQHQLRERLPVARTALVTSYGLTESSTAATIATPAELAAFPDTVGRPVIGAEVQIRDSAGQAVPDGVEGEICVRSPYVMLGYWNDDAATAAAITADRWLRTGDIGVLADGRLRLSGRRSDLILRGGENVYPVEIEQCLDEHPAVRECAVVGIPDPDLGQQVAAVVVLENPAATTEAELRAFAAERLAYYKVPARWRLTTTELPRNATGKVVRTGIEV
ncbi:putative fatty-acid--CoA ligase [Nocardia brasiliensis NBRC 14402]|uniref:class I adenylate-forming enzyme family protein n=1 Tax=Nocardia brasiliensis TaxID=37326 RepID=UPI000317C220|nr:class I adenylate-forming enzyme family protein [Nocardia brasiliensis]ASF12098.1 fatty acid--CoA ligase [Nocardia brasiliensis]GAJ80092.1 putative fatty-acid--CoA ligase [Nocardia brasiliensis NBRC 14402]SUB52996.1 Long-chain-fatty-acid--CoA ligase [Nocardia brasiliensis]